MKQMPEGVCLSGIFVGIFGGKKGILVKYHNFFPRGKKGLQIAGLFHKIKYMLYKGKEKK